MLKLIKTCKKEVVYLFVSSFIVLIGLQLLTYWSMQKASQAWNLSQQSSQLNQLLEVFMSDMKDIETGIRGYALTGQPVFLEPYHYGLSKISQDEKELEKLLENPIDKRLLEQIKLTAQKRVDIATHIVEIQKTQGQDIAKNTIAEGQGKKMMDQLRTQANVLMAHQQKVSELTTKKARLITDFTKYLSAFGFLLALVLQAMAFYLILREMKQRFEAEKLTQELNLQLKNHIQELDVEINERQKAEEAVQLLNQQLSSLVELLNETNIELKAVNKELETFSYSVSHDLRSPLRGIDGISLALLEDYRDKIDEGGQYFLRQIRLESQRMGQLIDGILNLSRLTREAFHRQTVDLSHIATEINDSLKLDHPLRDIEVDIQSGIIAEADPALISAVLQNLFMNAWKFTSKREHAKVQFGTLQKEDQTCYFVKDNGAGFDMAFSDKLFGPFQRLHGTLEFPGTGIGLATVQRIIHRHGGIIWAESEVDQGATFYFTLNESDWNKHHEQPSHSLGGR